MYHSLKTTLYHGTASEIKQIDANFLETNEYLCEACDRELDKTIFNTY